MNINKLLVLIVPILIFFLLELFFFFQNLIYISLVLGGLLIFYVVQNFAKASIDEKKWWNYIILPFLFYISAVFFSSIVINQLLVQLTFIITAIFIYLYLKQIYYLMLSTDNTFLNTLENISSYGNFLIILFFASAIYGLQSFLNISIWLSTLAFIPIITLSAYEVFWSNKLDKNKFLIFIVLLCIILTEIAWAAAFLPLNHYVVGFLLAICYYMLVGLIRFYLRKNLNKKLIRLYLLFGSLSLIIILLTARWM